jgi:transcriptional regulator
MHPTPTFHWGDRDAMLAFVADQAFATIVATIEDRHVFAQAPVIVDGDQLLMHLSRANPIAKALPLRASILVAGADAYVSPDWYEEADQVPTWNYVSVELEGRLAATDDAVLRDIVRRESAVFEARIAGKPPWTLDKMTPSVLAAKLKGIIGATFAIETARGTRKLSQNKTETARTNVAEVLATSPREADRTIGRLMRS